MKTESEVVRLCPTLSNPMDCSPPGSSAHGILQARALEWGAIAFSDRKARGLQMEEISCRCQIFGFPGGSLGKNPPATQETPVLFLGQEDPLEKG